MERFLIQKVIRMAAWFSRHENDLDSDVAR